jgi:hypothetical protein
MSRTFRLLFSAAVAAVPISGVMYGQAVSAPSGDEWRTLAIPDLGTRVQYPAGIFSVSDGAAEKGIGQRLSTSDGRATLSVYSRANESGETPAAYLHHYLLTPRSQLHYQRVTPSFFAISAVKNDTIYYSRCNFSHSGARAVHCLDLVYPAREKGAWDAIVTRISLSLRPLQKQGD